jgi:hypothetical protein
MDVSGQLYTATDLQPEKKPPVSDDIIQKSALPTSTIQALLIYSMEQSSS